MDIDKTNKFNKLCYFCKNGRYMTSTGWIICHGYSTPKKSNEIISLEETSCKKYEKEDVR